MFCFERDSPWFSSSCHQFSDSPDPQMIIFRTVWWESFIVCPRILEHWRHHSIVWDWGLNEINDLSINVMSFSPPNKPPNITSPSTLLQQKIGTHQKGLLVGNSFSSCIPMPFTRGYGVFYYAANGGPAKGGVLFGGWIFFLEVAIIWGEFHDFFHSAVHQGFFFEDKYFFCATGEETLISDFYFSCFFWRFFFGERHAMCPWWKPHKKYSPVCVILCMPCEIRHRRRFAVHLTTWSGCEAHIT